MIDRTEGSVTFRQPFIEVSQSRAVFNETRQLNLPESSLKGILWDSFKTGIPPHPYVRTFLLAKEIALMADPNLKKSLTGFYRLLKRNGVDLDFEEPMELEVDLNKLTGAEIEFEYVSGLGVTRVKVLHGATFPQPTLELLAYISSARPRRKRLARS